MAGERKGKTYEALIKVALEGLKVQGKVAGNIFWNEKAVGMTVTPDFTIGKDLDHPAMVILISHSNSAKNSDMKSWRNLGELAECKLRLKSIPKVFSVAFDSVVKDNLKAVGAAAFEGQLIVGDRPYGASLVGWIDLHHDSLPKDGDEKAAAIQDLIDKKDDKLTPLFTSLLGDLKVLLGKPNPTLDSLWAMERKRTPGKAPQAKTTSVRRGLSKLLIFEDLDLALRLYRGQKVSVNEMPQYAFDLKLAGKSTLRALAGDSEVASAINLLTDDQIRSIISRFDVSKISGWLKTLRNATHLVVMGAYVLEEYDSLCFKNTLYDRLDELHGNPWALIDPANAPTNWPPDGVWLFDILLELVKTLSRNANGYGLAQLGADVIKAGHGSIADLKSATGFGGGFGLSGWARRDPRAKFSKKLLRGVSDVLSKQMSKSTLTEVKKSLLSQRSQIIDTIINAKLCSYSGFDPLGELLEAAIPGLTHIRLRACYAEAASLRGSVAVIQLGKSKSTLINWQSATDDGKDHKVKELCGRAAALRYTWDESAKEFVQRPGVKKLCLVVDGSWTQSDLDTLALAGWDEIFYPDEMAKLVKAIV